MGLVSSQHGHDSSGCGRRTKTRSSNQETENDRQLRGLPQEQVGYAISSIGGRMKEAAALEEIILVLLVDRPGDFGNIDSSRNRVSFL